MFISVDLPEPDGPMIATYSLVSMSRSTPFRAWTFSSPTSYTRCRSRITISMRSSALPAAGSRGLGLDLGAGLELAERLVRPRNHLLAVLQLAEHLDHGLAGDSGADRDERRDAAANREQAGDLLGLATDRVFLGRHRRAAPRVTFLALLEGAVQLGLRANHDRLDRHRAG